MSYESKLKAAVKKHNPEVSAGQLAKIALAVANEYLREPCEVCGTDRFIVLERNDFDTEWIARCIKCGTLYEYAD